MNKKKIKYPDGGTLPTYTTGTPEYEAYLAKQKAYNDFLEREKSYSGYGNYTVADKATFGSIQPMIANPNTTATGYRIYNTKTAPANVASDEHYDPNTGRYSVPYYDSPGEATIVKSQAELDAEKNAAAEAEWKKQYQGYTLENIPIQNEDGSWSTTQEATPFPVGQTPPEGGTFHTDLPAGAVVKMASGGNLDTSTIGSLAQSMTMNNSQYSTPMQGENSYEGMKSGLASVNPMIGMFHSLGKFGESATTQVFDDKQKGAAIGESIFDPFKSNMKIQQSSEATGLEKALGFVPVASGFVNNNITNRVEGEKNKQSFLNKDLPTFPFGGDMNNTNKRQQSGFTLRPNQYGEQNYFDYITQGQIDIGANIGDISAQSEKIGLFDSIKHASQVNKNTRESGRDVARVKLNAFVDRDVEGIPQLGCGGSVKKMSDGGDFIEYNGATHAEGGIPIDQNGQPTIPQMAQAEVETGETMHNDGIDKYIFSDRLMQDPKSKITFADASKKINKKYKDTNDPYQKQARELELNRLKQEQEIFKSTIAGTQNNQQTPMFPDGGVVGSSGLQLMPEDKNLGYDFELNPNFNNNPQINPLNYNPNIGLTIEGQAKDYYLKNGSFPTKISGAVQNELYKKFPDGGPLQFGPVAGVDPEQYFASLQEPLVYAPEANNYYGPVDQTMSRLPNNTISSIPFNLPDYSKYKDNSSLSPIYFDPKDNIKAPNEDYTLQEESYVKGTTPKEMRKGESSTNQSGLPQDKINPLGFAASNMGNVYDLFQAARPLEKNKFDKVSLDTISLESQRRELEKQAGLARDTNRESVRNLATSSGQALGNQIVGNALINSSLGSGLSQSFLNEATTNTDIKNRQELANNQIRQSEIIADQMDKAKRQSTTSQALHSVGQNTQGYVRDLKTAEVGNENNKMWFDAINNSSKYFIIGYDANNNPVYQPKDGSGTVITKPKNA